VKDLNTTSWRWTIRGLDNKVLREFESWGPGFDGMEWWMWIEDYIYRNGQLVMADAADGGRRQFHLDHLGTPKVISNGAGNPISKHVYWPFGVEATALRQEILLGNEREEPMKFTGHERDFTGGLFAENTNYIDYMHARYYNPTTGRFLGTDPGRDWDMGLSQSWNMYAYVTSNPVNFIDPTGMATFIVNGQRIEADMLIEVNAPYWTLSDLLGMADATLARERAGFDAWAASIMSTGRTTARDFPRATGQGLAAFADGVIPFADPLVGLYGDGSVAGTEYSYLAGQLTRDVEITLASTGSTTVFGKGAWINRNPIGAGRLRIGHSPYKRATWFSVRGKWVDARRGVPKSHWDLWIIKR